MTLDPAIAWTLRLGLASLFALAAYHKLGAPRAFVGSVRAYRLLPAGVAAPVVALLVAGELSASVLLVAPVAPRLGAVLAAGLLVLYAAAIGINVVRGRVDLDCGCAGPAARRPVSAGLVVRNLVFLAGALMLLAPVAPRSLTWLDGVTVLAAAAALAALVAGAEQLVTNRPAVARARGTA